MLSSIQRTSNYQNSRPNFGMAISKSLAEEMIFHAKDLSTMKKVEAIATRAAQNTMIDVRVTTKEGEHRHSDFINGTRLFNRYANKPMEDTFVPYSTSIPDLNSIEQQVIKAEELSRETIADNIRRLAVDA